MHGSRTSFQGGPGLIARKQSGQRFFVLVLNLFYSLQRGSNRFIAEKTVLFQGSRGGVRHFPRGSKGGRQIIISIETHIMCDFPWGVRTPYPPPLDPHMMCRSRGGIEGPSWSTHVKPSTHIFPSIFQILFIAGLSFVIGLERTFRFFFQRHKLKATGFFMGGIFIVLFGWPMIGMCLEAYGFFLLFRLVFKQQPSIRDHS